MIPQELDQLNERLDIIEGRFEDLVLMLRDEDTISDDLREGLQQLYNEIKTSK